MQADAAQYAADKNQQNVQNTNDINRLSFMEGRGSTGNAILPIYGGGFEAGLFGQLQGYNQAGQDFLGTPQAQLLQSQKTLTGFQPTINAANKTVQDIFNGGLTSQRLDYQAPVNQARVALAQGQKQGFLQALSTRLNALEANSRRAGYTGTGSFAQNRLLGAGFGANQEAANVMGAANLANATDIAGIRNLGIQQQLSGLDLPYQQAQQALQFNQLPVSQLQANAQAMTKPFDFFRIAPASFRADQLPMIQPLQSPWAVAALQAGGIANSVGKWWDAPRQNATPGSGYDSSGSLKGASDSYGGYYKGLDYGNSGGYDSSGSYIG